MWPWRLHMEGCDLSCPFVSQVSNATSNCVGGGGCGGGGECGGLCQGTERVRVHFVRNAFFTIKNARLLNFTSSAAGFTSPKRPWTTWKRLTRSNLDTRLTARLTVTLSWSTTTSRPSSSSGKSNRRRMRRRRRQRHRRRRRRQIK